MEIIYTFYFFAFLKKVIKKLLTFCYWCPHKALPILEKIVYTLQVHMFEKKGSEKYEQKEI